MANTTLTQTGAQVQAILDKADKLPSTLGTAGQVLTMNAGATAAEWKTPSGGGGSYPAFTTVGYRLNVVKQGTELSKIQYVGPLFGYRGLSTQTGTTYVTGANNIYGLYIEASTTDYLNVTSNVPLKAAMVYNVGFTNYDIPANTPTDIAPGAGSNGVMWIWPISSSNENVTITLDFAMD